MERIWLGEIYICVNDLFDAPIQRVTLYTLCISGTNFLTEEGKRGGGFMCQKNVMYLN